MITPGFCTYIQLVYRVKLESWIERVERSCIWLHWVYRVKAESWIERDSGIQDPHDLECPAYVASVQYIVEIRLGMKTKREPGGTQNSILLHLKMYSSRFKLTRDSMIINGLSTLVTSWKKFILIVDTFPFRCTVLFRGTFKAVTRSSFSTKKYCTTKGKKKRGYLQILDSCFCYYELDSS